MPFSRRARKSAVKEILVQKPPDSEPPVPAHFRCPISLELMKDPVTATSGITYDRQSIEAWLDTGRATCPVTSHELKIEDLTPNHSIRRMIQDWCVANRSLGIERIPTPRIPVTGDQASEILSEIAAASGRDDKARCRELAARVKNLAKESDRSRRCFASKGAGRVLATAFSSFAQEHMENSAAGVLETFLSALISVSPLDKDALRHVALPGSLRSLVLTADHGDLAARLNAVFLIKEIVSSEREWATIAAKTEGLIEALVKLIKEPISPQSTKSSLLSIYYLVNGSGGSTAAAFVELGMIPTLLEILVDAEKSVCEKALAVLDGLLSSEAGRVKARRNALAVPVLIKKMFRVSDATTEFAVSSLWKLCKESKRGGGEGRGEECLIEALQMGAFQKLLLLLQVGCSDETKEKAAGLLKLLNGYKGRGECIDTMDFKGLKRSY
ncbi:U-box domain-containing protein 21-like [Typha latifolia]|uniref:U-box domain-containing protein 21-like n=1 Tax=Typha latifolia TaxID=4733 RepID=UPI003C2D2069